MYIYNRDRLYIWINNVSHILIEIKYNARFIYLYLKYMVFHSKKYLNLLKNYEVTQDTLVEFCTFPSPIIRTVLIYLKQKNLFNAHFPLNYREFQKKQFFKRRRLINTIFSDFLRRDNI